MEVFTKRRLTAAILAATTATLIASCGSDSDDDSNAPAAPKQVTKTQVMSFNGIDAPATDADKRLVRASGASIDGKDIGIKYHTLARSGEEISGIKFGRLVKADGTPLQANDGSERISDSNEFTSLLPVGNKLFSVSQFESRPGAMFLLELDQNSTNGELSVKSMQQIDQSGVNGGWVHCAASVTPWTTHLASEEYEPDARSQATSADVPANSYSGPMLTYYADPTEWNPYYYGWNIEVKVNEDASTNLTKHYAMGRLAFELSKVMADKKTVYMTDDGTNVGFYMFVADNAGDLSAGTTYAAKWNQTSAAGAGKANIEWISLGHATDAEISAYVNGTGGQAKLKFTDIFNTADPLADNTCPAGFNSVNAGGRGHECLEIKAGMEKAASRMETRRYAAIKGATTELRKEEGVTYDEKRHKIYLAISQVAKGMEAGTKYDVGGPDHIQLDKSNNCGAVYQLDLAYDKDIGSLFVAKNMEALVAGRPVSDQDPQVAGFDTKINKCHIDGIASPDNLTYIPGYDKLIIGEDTGSGHQNDAIWAYDFASGKLTRIQTTPYGAETTSPYWYPDINGWAYLMSVVQHPYGESDQDKNTNQGEARAYTGYIGPFPAYKNK